MMDTPSALSAAIDQVANIIEHPPTPSYRQRPRIARLRTNVGVFDKEGIVRFLGVSKTTVSFLALAQLCQIANQKYNKCNS